MEVDVNPEEETLAEESVLMDEAEFNERKRQCHDMEMKFGVGEALAEELFSAYYDFLIYAVASRRYDDDYSQAISKARRLMNIIDYPAFKAKLLANMSSHLSGKREQLQFVGCINKVEWFLSQERSDF